MPDTYLLQRTLRSGVLLISLFATTATHSAEPANLLHDFGRGQLIIFTVRDCTLFDVYLAETAEQRGQGLMFVKSMGEYEGMLFIYPQAAPISMWMKNTLIPLDMFFLDGERGISSIHENAEPLSTDIISSNAVVAGVIELNGGAAQRFGIRPGDRVAEIWRTD